MDETLKPDPAVLVITRYAPTARRGTVITPGHRVLTITRYLPAIVMPVVVSITTVVDVALSPFNPTVLRPRSFTPGLETLTLQRYTPRTLLTKGILVGDTALTITRYAPSAVVTKLVTTGTATLTTASYAPTLTNTYLITPGTQSVLLAPQYPSAEVSGIDLPVVDLAGEVIENYTVVSTYAQVAPRFREPYTGEFSSLLALGTPIEGPLTAGGVTHSIPTPKDNNAGFWMEQASVGYDWFDTVHFLPRSTFAFGLILSQKTATYEVFNSWREDITFTALTNNIGSSVTLPDLPTPPFTMGAFTSFLDPTSTHTSGASKNKVLLELVVSKDGPPTFDNTLVWSFSTGDEAVARLTGSRISLIPLIYESEFEETLDFISNTIAADDGTEQVLSLVGYPVQGFRVTYLLDAEDRQRMQMLLMGGMPRLLAFPVWHEDILTTATASAGATSVSVSATTDVDYRVGGFAVLWSSATSYDVVQLTSVSTNSLGFTTTPLTGSYGSGTRVAPLRLGYIVNDVPSSRFLVNLDQYTMQFRVTDNETGMFAGSTTGWSTYSTKVLLDDPNIVDGGMEVLATTRVQVIDNNSGVVEYIPLWNKSRRNSTKGFSIRSRAEMMKVKRLLLALRGPQVSFRLPTFAEDVTVVANLASLTFTMDIRHIGYTQYAQSREPRKVLRVTFTDGTSLVRVVQSSVEVSTTVERLTLDLQWPSTKTPAEVRRVEFYEPVRFDTDVFTFRYQRTGWASLRAPVKTLMDA